MTHPELPGCLHVETSKHNTDQPCPTLTPEQALRDFIDIQQRAYTMQRRALERLVRALEDPDYRGPAGDRDIVTEL
jgi:hypothetical protein